MYTTGDCAVNGASSSPPSKVEQPISGEKQLDSDADLNGLVRRLEGLELTNSECFLCANTITDGHYTLEHVIPAWAQRRYNLWDEQLVLLNGTGIPYRQLTVPCCDDCNRDCLGALEDSLSQAVEAGYRAVNALPRKLFFLWLAKVFLGMLYREMFLLLGRSSPSSCTIITPEFLRTYKIQRLFLQQVREKVRLIDFEPGSVFVFPAQLHPRKELQWDLCDNVDTQFIACRIGGVAMFSVLGDGGAQQHLEDEQNDIKDLPLHPLQFLELCATFSYRSTLATRTPKYLIGEGAPHKVWQMPLGGFSLKPLFECGDTDAYVQVLHHYTTVPLKFLFEPPDRVTTWLRKPTGEPNFIDINQYPEW
jgi:hypothetical protein